MNDKEHGEIYGCECITKCKIIQTYCIEYHYRNSNPFIDFFRVFLVLAYSIGFTKEFKLIFHIFFCITNNLGFRELIQL